MFNNQYMLLAIEQAKLAFKNNEIPVGAVIVEENNVIACAYNKNIALNDSTAHAEILAIKQACEFKKTSRLENCDIYITLEPCFMCMGAISLAKIKRVYYGASEKKFGAIENEANIFSKKLSYFKPEIYSGISETESQKILQQFFKNKRNLSF